ncbi:MAG: hypothetical protein AAF311_00635 [Pseudomonadota bacterium]
MAVAVLDFGKTHTRIVLFSDHGRTLARLQCETPHGYVRGVRTEDTETLERWLCAELAELEAETIVPLAHGAAWAAIDPDSPASAPVLDYLEAPPPDLSEEYDAVRPGFAETGSPGLGAGLNMGRQLFWMEQSGLLDTGPVLLPLAQYWAWRMGGHPRSDVSSLGCHTDLWSPHGSDWSSLARAQGWADRFAPLADAGAVVGQTDWTAAGKARDRADILCGLHDSNAAMLALRHCAPDADLLLSTGTWHVLSAPGSTVLPDADADGVINVTPDGEPLPSYRFMGGEVRKRIGADETPSTLEDVRRLVASRRMIDFPVLSGSGPFGRFAARQLEYGPDAAALSDLHTAMVWNHMISKLAPQARTLVVEGPASGGLAPSILSALHPGLDVLIAPPGLDAAYGGFLLARPGTDVARPTSALPVRIEGLDDYAAAWRRKAEALTR